MKLLHITNENIVYIFFSLIYAIFIPYINNENIAYHRGNTVYCRRKCRISLMTILIIKKYNDILIWQNIQSLKPHLRFHNNR